MRVVVQRVKKAQVDIIENGKFSRTSGAIGNGLLVLLGIENSDTQNDIDWLASKVATLRIFEDEAEKMNLSVLDVNGDILVVSQFTLYGNLRKGSRPSFNRSAHPDISIPLYEAFVKKLSEIINKKIPTGEFGAMMDVSLVNDGPVTIIIDSKNRDI